MDVEKVAAQLDRLAQAENEIASQRIVGVNGKPQTLQISPAFLALATINLHLRLRNIEVHLGIVEQTKPPAEAEPGGVN